MVVKKGLGKGLDSMIPEGLEGQVPHKKEKPETENVSRETLISINEIIPNKSQPRKKFDEDAIHDLAESIKIYGVIQPLILQKRDKYYEIIAGERRWRAAKEAGVKKVPAIIKEYTSKEIMEISLIENIQREDLNAIEEALAYQNLIQEFHLKQDEVAERVSKSRTAITNSLRLLKLDKRVQQMLIDDLLSSGHVRTLIPIEDGDMQYTIATKIFDEKLSVRETEKLIKKMRDEKNNPVPQQSEQEIKLQKASEVIYRGLEDQMKHIFGTKVSIKTKAKDKGKIEIEYYSQEELDRLIDLMSNIKEK